MALAGGALPISVAQAASAAPPAKYATADIIFPGNDGKPHKVTFDKNSFMVDGQRLNVWSGEIHYWRAPDVNSWRDLFQKMRANGYNAVSLYFFWGLHQSKEGGPFDFSKGTIKDLDLLLTMAQEEGLYGIARPGPYVNAEISMGGLPAWMTNYSGGLRTTDPKVLAASKAWLHAFNQIASKHLVTKGGGSVLLYQVENELLSDNAARGAFLKSLVSQVKSDGIDVPLFHNDYGLGGRFKNTSLYGTDFYAYDKYPVGFNCSAGRNRIDDSEATFRSYAPNSPHFITESQGGAFTPWGASYNASDCYTYTDEGFTRQWGVHNIGNGVTAFNYYMAYGGTNWGWTGAPASGFTSYDYGAGITEDRTLTPKASVQKETGYYTKAVPELSGMTPVQAPSAVVESGSNVKIYARQAEAGQGSVTGNGVRTYAMRLANSNDTTETTFTTALSLGKPRGATTTGFSHDDRS
ncbi:MAG: beta-galactosidase, partial [Actinomyces graevenitzii]|nr:beta-galactosidase [Actinomyces graevenitzii]